MYQRWSDAGEKLVISEYNCWHTASTVSVNCFNHKYYLTLPFIWDISLSGRVLAQSSTIETLLSLQPTHSATPDTALIAPQSPPQSFVPCFLSSPVLSSFFPSLSPPLWSSCPPPPCAPSGRPQWPTGSVTCAVGPTWGQLVGERGLQRAQTGAEVLGEYEEGEHAASCDRGNHLLQSCRWSPRRWGGLLHCSGPLTDEFALGRKDGVEEPDFLLQIFSYLHKMFRSFVSLQGKNV